MNFQLLTTPYSYSIRSGRFMDSYRAGLEATGSLGMQEVPRPLHIATSHDQGGQSMRLNIIIIDTFIETTLATNTKKKNLGLENLNH